MKSIDLQVAFGAVKHFGRNLYTSNPPAVAELVANSWDAYATKCIVHEENNELFIIDNGIGMNDAELRKNYAVSGSEKKTENIRIPDNFQQRPYMGRKGIGKFSAFSLGETYNIYTKSSEDSNWKYLTFNYEELLVDEPTINIPIKSIENIKDKINIENEIFKNLDLESGTIIHIPNLRRKFIKNTTENLKNILSRRFSVNTISKFNFVLFIRDEEVDLASHFYDHFVEFIYYFNLDEQDIKNRFPSVDEKFMREVSNNTFLNDNNITGWIGSVNQPNKLKIEDMLNSEGVIVYINGKLADENILKNVKNSRISNSYIVGEVNADFLQDEILDPVLSSRDGLNSEIENVEELKNHLTNIRQSLINDWNTLRAERDDNKQDYLKKMLETEKYQTIYNSLDDLQQKKVKKIAQSIFDNDSNVKKADYKYYSPLIFDIVNKQQIDAIEVTDEDPEIVVLQKIYQLFEKATINNALRLQSHIEDRLKIINQLKESIDQEAKEKVFEEHLATNPWLLSPLYDTASPKRRAKTQSFYKTTIDNTEVTGYADIIISVAENPLPIIVELKREMKTQYSTPKTEEIINQIFKYRKAILEQEASDGNTYAGNDYNDIDAFFICGRDAYDKISPADMNRLESNNNIQVYTYQQLILQARGIYEDIIDDEELFNGILEP